jgi:alkylhydroperoxidase family enzyme
MSNPIERYAPDVARALDAVYSARNALDIDLEDPPVENFADQFGVDVSVIDDDLRRRFLEATGPTAFEVTQAIYVDDYWPRIAIVSGEVLGGGSWSGEVVEPTELWPLLEEFMRQVARLDTLDPVLTELIRLRGARQHECRLCKSRRSVAALDAGADESTFDAVDAYADSDLPPATKAALALTDSMIWTPYVMPRKVAEDALEHLAPEQIVEVVLDVTRNAANKIAVALGADAPAITDGVELFVTDADGNLSVVGDDPL